MHTTWGYYRARWGLIVAFAACGNANQAESSVAAGSPFSFARANCVVAYMATLLHRGEKEFSIDLTKWGFLGKLALCYS